MNTIKLTKEEREQVNNFIENMIAHRKPWLQKES